jgi:hypothetical protein
MVWQLLAKPLLGVVADGVKGFVETKKAKAELKVTEVKAATKLKQDQIAGKVAWEASAVDQMKGSWKDELILICLTRSSDISIFSRNDTTYSQWLYCLAITSGLL